MFQIDTLKTVTQVARDLYRIQSNVLMHKGFTATAAEQFTLLHSSYYICSQNWP